MLQNITLFQFFHWYYSPEGNLWQHVSEQANWLPELGITHVWLPPAYKSAKGINEPGYAVYDLYDLGEFDQQGAVRTRYGTKQEYLDCIKALHNNGMAVIADVVMNHKLGADENELVPVQQVNAGNRKEFIGEPTTIEAYTKFTFPGRNKQYSDFEWNWQSFTGIDAPGNRIYLIQNEYTNGQWDELVEEEMGNFDYLMGADIEFRNPYVREELKRWGKWYIETTGVDALRLDAVKHIGHHFLNEWIGYLKDYFKKDFLVLGEYWRNEVYHLIKYTEATHDKVHLFDVPLHFNFYKASLERERYDLRTILDNTLLREKPGLAITFVDNHDTQPLQSLQSPVDYWFKPLAYALILLREQGIPCVFYPTLYEAKYVDHLNGEEIYVELNGVWGVDCMLKTRLHLAYGVQKDYFDHPNTIGWTREGIEDKPYSGCAVVITNSLAGDKQMDMGKKHCGRRFVNVCGDKEAKVVIDENGMGIFYAHERSAAVWIDEEALKFF